MARLILFILIAAGLGCGHAYVLEHSREIAIRLVETPYKAISDAEALRQIQESDRARPSYYSRNRAPDSSDIAMRKAWHYEEYVRVHVEPTQEHVKLGANIVFASGYVVLGLIALRVLLHWALTTGVLLVMGVVAGLSWLGGRTGNALGVKRLLANHQLSMAEREFRRVKTLFDNGLITEPEFDAKRAQLRAKIRESNFVSGDAS